MSERKDYKVMAISTFSKTFDISAKNEEYAKRIAKALVSEDGGDGYDRGNLISETFVAGCVSNDTEDKNNDTEDEENHEITQEEFDRFDKLNDAFYDFCLQFDDCEEMADDMDECFEEEIEPFDPYKLFYWKPIFNAEIKEGKSDTLFSGGEMLHKNATLIDIYEMQDFDPHCKCSAATGCELWLTDDFEFVTTRYAEMVERDDNGNQLLAMRYRVPAEKDFYEFVGEFHSEDFFEIFQDKIEESKKRKF